MDYRFTATVRVTPHRCSVIVRDGRWAGQGGTRDATSRAFRIAADMMEFADSLRMVASADGSSVELLALSDWSPADFALVMLEVREHCNWDVDLVGDVVSE